ncbi:hypothetical protein H8N03_25050 [Ramlibacter sp. USB13]|uniref:Uncharacterized protein n=1 Tax=Ramlibacter cellulosilyticus TaxID=2764187 RepID=A0A923MY21_9BURK|nr:hypothetical protein [Ramlibacter cellulosilyticus]MBC5786229.1 hypothetical protein [Ramlibacter cellulosilyticus]
MDKTHDRRPGRHKAARHALRRLLHGLVAVLFLLAAGLAARGVRADTLDQQNAPANWGGGANQFQGRAVQTISPTLGCLPVST